MLEAMILKVRHRGRDAARELLPYIQACDIFCPEFGFSTEEQAISTEQSWLGLLQLGSRTELQRTLKKSHRGAPAGLEDTEFTHTLADYLFRNQKPIYVLERFTPQESLQVQREFFGGEQQYTAGIAALRAGQDEGIQHCYHGLWRRLEADKARDKNIAANLEQAEERIRARYPALAGKQPLHYAITIGLMHSPEQFVTTVPYRVVTSATNIAAKDRLFYQAETLVREELSVEAVAPLFRQLAAQR